MNDIKNTCIAHHLDYSDIMYPQTKNSKMLDRHGN